MVSEYTSRWSVTCIEVCDVERRERDVPTTSGAYSGILIILYGDFGRNGLVYGKTEYMFTFHKLNIVFVLVELLKKMKQCKP